MAILNYVKAALPGTSAGAAAAAAAGGDQVLPSLNGALLYTNASGGSITVTVNDPTLTKYGQATTDPPTVIPAGGSAFVGPFGSDLANASGYVDISYSGVTSLTVRALQI